MKSRLWKHFHTKHTVDWKELTVKCYIDWLSMPRYLTKCWLVQWLHRVASSSQAPTFNDDCVCLLVSVALVHVQRVAGEGAEQQQQERGAGPHVDCGGAGRRLSCPAATRHHRTAPLSPLPGTIHREYQDSFPRMVSTLFHIHRDVSSPLWWPDIDPKTMSQTWPTPDTNFTWVRTTINGTKRQHKTGNLVKGVEL